MDELTPAAMPAVAEQSTLPPPPPLPVASPAMNNLTASPLAAPPDQLIAQARFNLARSITAARWFYWIAGLSVLNSIIKIAGGKVVFVFGLGTTQITDYIFSKNDSPAIGLVIAVLISAVYVLFGFFATKRQMWAFATGLVLYILDGLIFLPSFSIAWFQLLFHGYIIYRIINGIIATQRFQQAEPTLRSMGALK